MIGTTLVTWSGYEAHAQTNTNYNGAAVNGGTHFMSADANSNSSAYLELSSSPSNASIGYVAGMNAPAIGLAHGFMVHDAPNAWPMIGRIMRNGKVSFGYKAQDESLLGIYSQKEVGVYERGVFSVDELSTGPGAAGDGSTCIGFNAIRQRNYDGAIRFEYNGNGKNGGALMWADKEGAIGFSTVPSNGGAIGNASGPQWLSPTAATNAYRRMRITSGGQVQIGQTAPPATSTHTDYRLAVDGKLVAKSIFVTQATANWADFVFAPTYTLQPLPELEAYLKQNRHLPAIPSAAEVEKNGIDVGEMNARLLQSLEELTLHVIALSKQNARLQAEVAALAAKVNQAAMSAASK